MKGEEAPAFLIGAEEVEGWMGRRKRTMVVVVEGRRRWRAKVCEGKSVIRRYRRRGVH